MKKLTNRSAIEEKEDSVVIKISPPNDEKALKQVKMWFALYSIAGLAMIIGAPFVISSREEFAVVFIYLAFWLFFEIKVFKALMYRIKGLEEIRFEKDKMTYTLLKGSRGMPKSFDVESMSKWSFEPKASSGFFGMINQGAWMIAGESISFSDKDGKFNLGIQMKKGDAEKLISYINKKVLKA